MQQIDALTLRNRLQSGDAVNMLDVREEIEFHTFNIGGKNIPLSKLNNALAIVAPNKTDELIVICKAGLRSTTAQAILIENGFTNVKNLTGGLLAIQRLPA